MKNNGHQEMTKEELEQIRKVTKEELQPFREEIRTELRQSLAAQEQKMDRKIDQKMARMEASIIRWFVGVFLAAVVVMSSLISVYTMMIAGKAG